LAEAIGQRLGRYRDFRRSEDTRPQVAVEIDHLQALGKAAFALHAEIGELPLAAEAFVWELIYGLGGDSYLSIRQLEQDLLRLGTVLNAAARQMEPYRNQRGRKTNSLEHSLLSDVAALLEEHVGDALGKGEIAAVASELLRDSRVSGLPSGDKARKVILAWRKRVGGSQ